MPLLYKGKLFTMRLQFWYSRDMKLWRWSLYTRHYAPEGKDYHQQSGQDSEVRDAMNHVADVVEKLVKEKNERCLN